MDGMTESPCMVDTLVTKLSKDADGTFGLEFEEAASGGPIVRQVSSTAQAQGVEVGFQLVSLISNQGMEYEVDAIKLRALASILQRAGASVTCTFSCRKSTARENSSSEASSSAFSGHDSTPVHTLRGLLSGRDIAAIHAAALELQRTQHIHQYDNELKGNHESLFLHEVSAEHPRGFFRHACPEICEKVIAAIRELHPGTSTDSGLKSASDVLGVRCIEYHCYRPGGSLLDPEHRDVGSTLTLSALLTDPTTLDGGVFMTWQGGEPVYHDDLNAGDAVVFSSERIHNVSAVMGGTRHSLVVELWSGPDNTMDRHS